MTIGPEHEQPQPGGNVFSVAFGDAGTGVYGLVRAGEESGMGLLFAGAEPVLVREEGARVETVEPLRRWRASLEGVFDVEVEALSPPARLSLGEMDGYEQLCRVRGTAQGAPVDCLGQRGHAWGRTDWSKLELARTVTAWLDERTAVALSAVRPASARHHADESIAAAVVVGGAPVPGRRPAPEHDLRRRRAATSTPASSCGSPTATASSRTAPPARCAAARRWKSGACGWTARSSSGAWRAASASAGTTSCVARDQGRHLGLLRRADDAAHRRVRQGHVGERPARSRRSATRCSARARSTARTRCSTSSAGA
jgi:hypothetical protein